MVQISTAFDNSASRLFGQLPEPGRHVICRSGSMYLTVRQSSSFATYPDFGLAPNPRFRFRPPPPDFGGIIVRDECVLPGCAPQPPDFGGPLIQDCYVSLESSRL